MAPFLQTVARCLVVPLDNKSLKNVAEREEQNIREAPFYEVAVRKSSVYLKPTEKGEKKLKRIDFKKATVMHIDENSNTIALSIPHKKNDSLCLDMRFSDSNRRKEFQTLAKTTNSQLRVSRTNNNVQSGSTSSSETHQRSNEGAIPSTLPLSSRRSSLPGGHSTYPNTGRQRSPSTKSGSICSHCHQKISNGNKSIKVEYDPHLPTRSCSDSTKAAESQIKNSCAIYVGPNGSAASIRRLRGRNMSERSVWALERNRLYNSDNEETTSIKSTSVLEQSRKVEIGTAVRVRPTSPRLFVPSKFQKLPSKESWRIKRSKYIGYKSPNVYFIWNSNSDDDDDDESDYDENNEEHSDYSDNSLKNGYPNKSRKAKRLLRNPHRLGIVRIRRKSHQ